MTEKTGIRRKDLKGPDEFFTTFGRTVAWCKSNPSKSLLGVVGAVAVLSIAVGTNAFLQWRENKSARDLWPTLNRTQDLLQASNAVDPSQLASVEQFLREHVRQHPRTRATVDSLYYLGIIAFHGGKYDLAIRQFREGIDTGKDVGIMRFLLRQGIANALEAKGDLAAAAGAYHDAATGAGAQLKSQSMFSEARMLDLSGKKTDAVALYRRILKETPETSLRDLLEIRLAQAE
jgi:TolA-binding protein